MSSHFPRDGTVIHGTSRLEDLIPAFEAELKKWDAFAAETLRKQWTGNWCDEYVCVLLDSLTDLAGPYQYFGTTEGDSSDYGWWTDLDGLQDAIDAGDIAEFCPEEPGVGRVDGIVQYSWNGDFASPVTFWQWDGKRGVWEICHVGNNS